MGFENKDYELHLDAVANTKDNEFMANLELKFNLGYGFEITGEYNKEELGYDNCDSLDNESITNIIRNYDYEVYSLQKSYPECFGLE